MKKRVFLSLIAGLIITLLVLLVSYLRILNAKPLPITPIGLCKGVSLPALSCVAGGNPYPRYRWAGDPLDMLLFRQQTSSSSWRYVDHHTEGIVGNYVFYVAISFAGLYLYSNSMKKKK